MSVAVKRPYQEERLGGARGPEAERSSYDTAAGPGAEQSWQCQVKQAKLDEASPATKVKSTPLTQAELEAASRRRSRFEGIGGRARRPGPFRSWALCHRRGEGKKDGLAARAMRRTTDRQLQGDRSHSADACVLEAGRVLGEGRSGRNTVLVDGAQARRGAGRGRQGHHDQAAEAKYYCSA